jgi:hypothetical protein
MAGDYSSITLVHIIFAATIITTIVLAGLLFDGIENKTNKHKWYIATIVISNVVFGLIFNVAMYNNYKECN